MKKISLVILALVGFMFFSINVLANSALELDDDGYYKIHNCSELQNISLNLSANYKLMSNINCSDTINWNNGSGFEPIGERTFLGEGDSFIGYFNGMGYNISNLYINISDTNYIGLFSSLEGYISNLNLIDFDVTSTSDYVGILAGYTCGDNLGEEILVSNVTSSGRITGPWYVGGLIGNMGEGVEGGEDNCSYSGKIVYSSSSVSIIGDSSYVGGLVGILNNGTVTNSFSIANITGTDYVGGLVGYNNEGVISQSYSNNGLISGDDYVGGLVGWAYSTIINNTFSLSNINATGQFIGGLVGLLGSEFAGSVYNSYSTGNVEGLYNVGGLVGGISNDDIHNSFSTGNVSLLESGAWIGGIFGDYQGDLVIENVYWYNSSFNIELNCYNEGNENCTSISDLTYFYNYDNAPMNLTSGDGWDFDTIWSNVYNGTDYPVFQWQNASIDITPPYVGFVSPENTTYAISSVLVNITNGSDAVSVWYYNGTSNISYVSPVTLTLSNGNYEFIAYANDSNGNINSSRLIFSVSVVSNNGDSSSSGYSFQTYFSNEHFPIEGNNFNLRWNDKIKFIVNFTNHTLTMQNFNVTSAKVKIESEPLIVWIEKDILYEFDLNNDSVNDVRVRYDGRDNLNRAMIFLQEILQEDFIITEDFISNSKDSEENECNSNYLFFITIVIFLIIFLIIFYRNYIKKFISKLTFRINAK